MQLRKSNIITPLCCFHDKISKEQRICINKYCQGVLKQLEPSGEETSLTLQGEYFNISGRSKFSQEILMKFLISEVSQIENFQSRPLDRRKHIFKATFKLRSAKSEDFLLDLKNWPLGVSKLNYCD